MPSQIFNVCNHVTDPKTWFCDSLWEVGIQREIWKFDVSNLIDVANHLSLDAMLLSKCQYIEIIWLPVDHLTAFAGSICP